MEDIYLIDNFYYVDILYDEIEPILFISSILGELYLGYLSESTKYYSLYVFSKINPEEITQLKNNTIYLLNCIIKKESIILYKTKEKKYWFYINGQEIIKSILPKENIICY